MNSFRLEVQRVLSLLCRLLIRLRRTAAFHTPGHFLPSDNVLSTWPMRIVQTHRVLPWVSGQKVPAHLC